ncbi:hypothetical protein RhiirA1_196181 [Rhizophagus irregularis]|uniref:Uncharacterized protein n=1 Tax=Rhizophagus irregularis TaxID=588596 RepID=A0A2N0SFV8_9GLOM|nr:hypothetical protein RhiirA1_196181 [Rhizophagus irregularis]
MDYDMALDYSLLDYEILLYMIYMCVCVYVCMHHCIIFLIQSNIISESLGVFPKLN